MYFLRGYHATDQKRAKGIEANGFLPSNNWYDWLGTGTYFYQDAIGFTRRWATHERAEGPIANPAIFAADIEYDGFLDLVEYGSMARLQEFYKQLETTATEAFGKAKAGERARSAKWRPRPHPLDCHVINEAVNALRMGGENVRAVRGVFYDGDPLHPTSDLYDRQHIQIAVLDPTLIKKVWRVE